MSKWEVLLLFIVAVTSNRLSYELGIKHERLMARREFLTERYVIDTQIADHERRLIEANRQSLKINKKRAVKTAKDLGTSEAKKDATLGHGALQVDSEQSKKL